ASFAGLTVVAASSCGGDSNGSGGNAASSSGGASSSAGAQSGSGGSIHPSSSSGRPATSGTGGEGGQPEAPDPGVGVIGTGQSLSVGATSVSISLTQPFANMKLEDQGPDPKYPIDGSGAPVWVTKPLTEPIRTWVDGSGPGYGDGQYPDNLA